MIPNRYLFIFFSCVTTLAVLALLKYPGQAYIYIAFTIISNILLYFGVRKNAIFFDTFIGAFFWLGFWLKTTFRLVFMDGGFYESVGNFTGTGDEFDRALLASSCGLFGLVVISLVREKFFFTYPNVTKETIGSGLFIFYKNNRKTLLLAFIFLITIIAATNFYFGIYQRGGIPRTVLPFGFNGVYKWLLLFGLASFSAMILKFELVLNKKTTYLPMGLALAETTMSNISLLSRGMILNSGALLYGVIKNISFSKYKTRIRFFIITTTTLVILFLSSVVLVNQIRVLMNNPDSIFYVDSSNSYIGEIFTNFDMLHASQGAQVLFLDRWVGIEGVLAVSTYPKQGWELWNTAWKEKFSVNRTSYYDENIITSPYMKTDKTKHHYISLPGIIAFSFYPGSYFFVFFCMALVGAIAAVIEFSVYKLGNKNIILCALLSQVVAYRYAHFGYVPGQSYLLFGSLFLNLFIIYFAERFFNYWYKKTGVPTKHIAS